MFKFSLKVLLLLTFLTTTSISKNFNEILINGNNRISDETIKVFSNTKGVNNLNENSINLILKSLYETGFFENIIIKIENNKLIINVIENPIIQTIFIEGIKTKKINDLIKDVITLKDRSSFNKISVKNDEILIINALKSKGYYFASLDSSIVTLTDNKVNLIYKINLGDKARISKISFIGDKKFKDSKLRNIILSEEYRFWKIVSGKKFLNEDLMNYDKKLLNNFYKNKGFFNVSIESSFANYLGDNKFELVYNILANKKFYFNDLSVNLPIDFDETNFDNLKLIFNELKGQSYSLNAIDEILNEIDTIVLNEQFEFLTSTVSEEIDNDLINLTFNIQETEKFYVEKINIYGNNITDETVIRNNLVVDEGDAFNELLHKKSINNIKSLNFFKSVRADVLNGSLNNQKIININVEEKPTGQISVGAGVGTDGGKVGFSIKESNFLGKGIGFGTDLSLSSESVRGLVSLTNPNYKGTNKSLNLSIESTVTDRLTNFGYKSNKTGFSVGSGFEYYDDFILNMGISSYVEKLETDSTASASMKKQKGSYFDTFFNYTLDYDKRNQRYQTTNGFRSRFTQNLPILSENYSLTNTYDYKIYNEWFNENIASFGFFAKATNSLTGKDVKLSDRVSLPSNKLRGFESGKVGPKDGADYIGGNYAMAINVSTTVPQMLPSLENIDFSFFIDAANVWGVDYNSNLSNGSKLRSSFGMAVDLFTVIGPLNFSLSEVLSQDKNDITESFRFNLGTTF
tara:strand:- start:2043 stop:4280 length:2238 start_codon:yes stop_codon:yes gene_type:complete